MDLKEKGFTLIEMIIALFILAIGILGLLNMQVAAINGNLSASQMTIATTLAQDQIEQLKRLPFTDAALNDSKTANNATLTTPSNASSFDQADANNPLEEGGREYQRYWNIADNTPTQGAKTVVAFVYWGAIGANGLPRHRVTIPTIIGQ